MASSTSPDPTAEEFVDPLDVYAEERLGKRRLQSFPRLMADSFRLVWTASPRDASVALGLQLVPALLVGFQVIASQHAFAALLRAPHGGARASEVLESFVAFAALSVVVTLTTVAHTQQQRVLSEVVMRQVWRRVLTVTSSVPLEYYDDAAFFDRLQRVQYNAVNRPATVAQSLVSLLGGVVGSVALFVALVRLQPLLVPLLLLAGLPPLLLNRAGSRSEFRFVVDQTPAMRERLLVQELLGTREPTAEIRSFRLGPFLTDRWQRLYDSYITALRLQVRRRILLALAGRVLAGVVVAGAGAVLVALLVTDRLSLAEAGAAALAARQLLSRLQQMSGSSSSLYESGLFLADLQSFLSLAPEGRPEGRQLPRGGFAGLRLEGVHFAYRGSDSQALDGVNLEIRPGEVIAVVGENGSGKSTLAKVLALLYSPCAGHLFWNGKEVAPPDVESLREEIALVFQSFVRYPLPAAVNIALGRVDRIDDDAGILKAARSAGAHSFIASLPAGYETYLSRLFKNGRELSGGQWQRVAIARAFFRDAPLVILDEPSSALDPRAEQDLFAALRSLLAERTVVFISHRFSTVREADRIIVMDAGRVAEMGSHDDLMAGGGLYAELFTMQASAYSTAPKQ